MAIPKDIKRGAFTEGELFNNIRAGYMKSLRKNMKSNVRKLLTQKLNEERRAIHKIVVTDDHISFFDKQGKLIAEL